MFALIFVYMIGSMGYMFDLRLYDHQILLHELKNSNDFLHDSREFAQILLEFRM